MRTPHRRCPLTLSLTVSALMLTLAAPQYAQAGTVTLKNGDKLDGNIVSETDDGVTLEHKTLGTLELRPEQVKSVAFSHSDEAYEAPDDGLNGWFFPGWDKSVEAGFNGSEGNSQNLSAYAAFNTKYEDERDRWLISANFFYASDDNVNTRNEWEAAVTKDWLIPNDPLFYFAKGKYEHDRFTGWEDRLSAFIGVGYELVKNDEFELIGRLGGGVNYEFGDVNDATPELLAGIEGSWKITRNQTFSFYNYFYPALDPFLSQFRNVTGVNYKVSIDTGRGLSLKLGAENEYQSEVEPGFKQNDLKYYGALVYDF